MPADTSAIDLSTVPAPAVIEALSYEDLYAQMLARLRDYIPDFDDSNQNDPAVRVLQVAAYYRLLDRQRVNDAAKAVMVAYAEDSDLDNLGILFRVPRLTGEDDDAYRERIQLAPDGYSVAGPEGAYVFLARSADARVRDASVDSPTPGVVVVTILSKEGDGTASADLLAVVSAALSASDVRPLTDNVTVQSAEIVNYTVDATIYTYAGPDKDVVMSNAATALATYQTSIQRLGRDVAFSGLQGALHVSGVQRVEMTTPAATISIGNTQAAYCTGVTQAWGGTDS